MPELVDQLDIRGLAERYIFTEDGSSRGAIDLDRRGNFQVNFGLATQRNVGPPPTARLALDHYGVTMPRVLAGTKEDPAIKNDMSVGWKIGSLAGIPFCKKNHLRDHPKYGPQQDVIRELLGSDNMWASMSLCVLPLEEGFHVNRHVDEDNCPSLTGVLNVSQVVYLVDRWVRISLIFYYMQKSLHDMLIRRLACMELATKCPGFLDRCEPRPTEGPHLQEILCQSA
jgi:hypothetical protein